jgi:hypothetical protein
VVPLVPVRGELHKGRTATVAGPVHGGGHRVVHDLGVLPVHRARRDAEGGGPPHDRAGDRGLGGQGRGVPVVFADEHHRHLPQRGEVERLQQRALGHRAVAEDAHRDPVAVPAEGPAEAGGDRRAVADGAAGTPDAGGQVGRVERAGPPTVDAAGAAGELGEKPGRVAPPGQEVTVAAVVAQQGVVGAQGGAHAGRDPLLPDAGMDAAGDVTGAHQVDAPLLETADQPDGAIEGLRGRAHARTP